MNITKAKKLYEIVGLSYSDEQIIHEINKIHDEEELDMDLDEFGILYIAVTYTLVDQNKAFEEDWKWSPESLLTGLKQVVPEINFKVIEENYDEDAETFRYKVEINGELKEFRKVKEEGIEDFLHYLNNLLETEYDKALIKFDDSSDTYWFIVVPKEKASEIVDNQYFLSE